jgi:lipopolysaccharide transport protein LptA
MRRFGPARALAAFLLLGFAPGAATPEDSPQEAAARFGLSLSADAPTSIGAQELEASRDAAGRERVVFVGDVKVQQGELEIFCDWLEATYPQSGEGGPEKLVARGNVRILQAETEAHCTEAVFEAPRNRAVCRSSPGPAVLRRGEDTVEGKEIHFDLARSTIKVIGGAFVRVAPQAAGRH